MTKYVLNEVSYHGQGSLEGLTETKNKAVPLLAIATTAETANEVTVN